MKKIILSVMLAATSVFTYAQKGVMEIGGTIGFSSNDLDEELIDGDFTKTSFSIMPSLMYYVTDNIAVGGKIGASYTKSEGDVKKTMFAIEPTARYNKELGNGFSWAPEFFIGLGFGKTEWGEDNDANTFAMSVALRFARFEYAINDKWNLSLNFGNFGYSSVDYDGPKATSFGLNLAEGSQVGIAYKF